MAKPPPIKIENLDTPEERQDYVWKRWAALKTERQSWDTQARDMASLLLPRASRFTTSETNQGKAKHNKIYDNTALRDVRILAAGMMSGLTSPARPWFKLAHPDEDLMKYEPVKVWCARVTRLILQVCNASNIYRTLHQSYTELGVFGTHAALVLPDYDTVIHSHSLTWGEYALAINDKGRVDTLYREMRMTAGAMARAYGPENLSPQAQQAYRRGNLDTYFDVIHAVEPNLNADPSKLDVKNMPFKSCYFEQGGEKGKYLRESGFKRFRALCPRWQTTGLDTYGESPGMEVIGDAKQLQHEQYRKALGIDYMTQPPVGLPTAMRGQEADLLPGGITYLDATTGTAGQRQLFDVRLDLNHLLADIQDCRQRIHSGMYSDLFLMISSMDASGEKMTATEVAERHEEKMLMLGPVLERLTDETVIPLISMIFDQLAEAGALPPAPPEMGQAMLKTELLGILAQAQRAMQTNGVTRFIQGVGLIAGIGKPEVADKIDGDFAVDHLADGLGVDPRLLVDDRDVAKTRQARAQAQAQAAQSAQGSAVADAAGKLAKVPTAGGASNAGADVLGMFTGYGSPQAERIAPGI